MKPGDLGSHCKPLIGQKLLAVEKKEHTWLFQFARGVSVATEAPWRLIEDRRIVVSSEDHGHQFGLPLPVDAAQVAQTRAAGRSVEAARISADSGDLILDISGGIQLQLLQLSSGYEAWRLSAEGGESICVGGGGIAHFPRR